MYGHLLNICNTHLRTISQHHAPLPPGGVTVWLAAASPGLTNTSLFCRTLTAPRRLLLVECVRAVTAWPVAIADVAPPEEALDNMQQQLHSVSAWDSQTLSLCSSVLWRQHIH